MPKPALDGEELRGLLKELRDHHGTPQWWPADSAFEVMVGAVLTQNTAWTNVERAITGLRERGWLEAISLIEAPPEELAATIRPSGYYNVKTQRLRNLCLTYLEEGGFEGMDTLPTPALRERLLAVQGVGRETADDILLYAFRRPVFVIDAYTRRIFSRLGWVEGNEPYDQLREAVEEALGADETTFNELHALLVLHGKDTCRPQPRCPECPVRGRCAFATGQSGTGT